MPDEQLSAAHWGERQLVMTRLQSAGWTDETGAGPSEDEGVPPTARLSHAGRMTLEVSYLPGPRALDLWLGSLGLLVGRRIQIRCHERLPELLDIIVGFQDEIDLENFRDHVRRLLAVCPDIFAVVGDTDEERLVRLVDEKEKG